MAIRVLSIVLGVAFGASGAGKLASAPASMTIRDRLKVAPWLWRAVGVAEVAGSLGLTVGLRRPEIGRSAAAGLAALMVGAIVVHRRAGDSPMEWVPAATLGVAAGGLVAGIRS